MPILQTVDREDVRLAVGYNANGVFEGSTTSASAGVTDIIDRKLRGGTDEHVGKWVVVTTGARDGDISQVSAYNATTFTLTLRPDLGGTLASGVSYEMYDRELRPEFLNNTINQAIHTLTGKAFDPEENVSLHLHGTERRYVIPTVFGDHISKLERRYSYTNVSIDPCESGWTQQTNVTQAFDTAQKREGGASLRLVLAAGLGAGADAASKTITSLDISKYDRIEFQIRSTVAAALGDFTLRLTSGSTTVAFSVPALVANTWHFHRVTLNPDDARQLTAVTTVVLRQVTVIAPATLWLDDIKAAENSTAKWEEIRQHLWDIDKLAGEIIFRPEFGTPPYNLLKITGGDKPVLLSGDNTVSEVDPTYLIAKCTELVLMATSGGPNVDPEARRGMAAYWASEAHKRLLSLPNRQNARQVA